MRRFIFVLINLLILISLNAKDDSDKLFVVSWDNDMFVKTDKYFTNGSSFTFYNGIKGIRIINKALALPFKNASNKVFRNYYTLEQNIYTPSTINDSLLRIGDRPYAGTLMLDYGTQYYTDDKLVWSQIGIGILGKYSFSKEAQNYVHEILNLNPGQGWEHQVSGAILFNVEVGLKQNLINQQFWQGGYNIEGQLGTNKTGLTIGVYGQTGNYNRSFSFYGPLTNNKKQSFNASLYFSPRIHYVFYDATLQGGVTGWGISKHVLKYSQIKPIVGELVGGTSVSYKFITCTGSIHFKSPEFYGATGHAWGNVTIGINF